jgi:hypothetical protein
MKLLGEVQVGGGGVKVALERRLEVDTDIELTKPRRREGCCKGGAATRKPTLICDSVGKMLSLFRATVWKHLWNSINAVTAESHLQVYIKTNFISRRNSISFLFSSYKKNPNSAVLGRKSFLPLLSLPCALLLPLPRNALYILVTKKPWGFASFPIRAKGEGEWEAGSDRLSRNVWIEAFILGEQSLLVWNSYGIRTGWNWRKVNRIPSSQVKEMPQYSVLQQFI